MMLPLTEQEFRLFQDFIFEQAGITMSACKKHLVSNRLGRRVSHWGLSSFGAYFQLLQRTGSELQHAVDLLTTNETYFFREPRHFDLLEQEVRASTRRPFRVWSAACSSGEEPYSIAMVLAEHAGPGNYEVLGTDISTRVLDRARRGHYAMDRASGIPAPLLKRYCLRGVNEEEGTLLVEPTLRTSVRFQHLNLNAPLPQMGQFDMVFLRNVMIYFSAATKREVVQRIAQTLRPGGLLVIGHSESIKDTGVPLHCVRASVYRKSAS
jgi:chemotaxis protein methyltransferase CheR